jgi:hypothetical protein
MTSKMLTYTFIHTVLQELKVGNYGTRLRLMFKALEKLREARPEIDDDDEDGPVKQASAALLADLEKVEDQWTMMSNLWNHLVKAFPGSAGLADLWLHEPIKKVNMDDRVRNLEAQCTSMQASLGIIMQRQIEIGEKLTQLVSKSPKATATPKTSPQTAKKRSRTGPNS